MKCLSCVALFCLIAIVSAGPGRAPDNLNRMRRQTNTFSSSSSSTSTQGSDGKVHFNQVGGTYQSFGPAFPVQVPNLNERFGADDTPGANPNVNQGFTGNFGSGGFGGGGFSQTVSTSSQQAGAGPVQFQHTSSYYGGPTGVSAGAPNLQDRFSGNDAGGNNANAGFGHISHVSGHYDPNTNKVVYHQNYHKDV